MGVNAENPIKMIETSGEIIPFEDAYNLVPSYRVRSVEEMNLEPVVRRQTNILRIMAMAISMIEKSREFPFYREMIVGKNCFFENSGSIRHPAERGIKHPYRNGR